MFKKFFEKFRTALRIGIIFSLRVIVYKFLLKFRLHPVLRIKKNKFFIISKNKINLCYNELKNYNFEHFWFFDKKITSFYEWKQIKSLDKIFLTNFFNGYIYSNHKNWYEIEDFDLKAGDIKGVWELSRWNWAIRIATDDKLKLNRKKNLLKSLRVLWMQHNPYLQGPNWKCGQEISLRIINYLISLRLLGLKPNNITDQEIKFIEQHLERIFPTISYAKGQKNNHWISEAVGLIVGGIWIGKKQGKKYIIKGIKELNNSTNLLFNKDGSFAQSSFNYLRHALTLISAARLELLTINRDETLFFKKKIINSIYLFKQFASVKTGKTHNWGANDGSNPLSIASREFLNPRAHMDFYNFTFYGKNYSGNNKVIRKINSTYGKYILKSKLNCSNKNFDINYRLKNGFTEFSDGGLIFFRNNNYQVLIRLPKFKFKPSQDDVGHFDIIYKKINCTLDAGTFSYFVNEKIFNFFQGAQSHNTIYRYKESFNMSKISKFIFGNWTSGHWTQYSKNKLKIVFKNRFSDIFQRNFEFKEKSILVKDKIIKSNSKKIVSGITLDAKVKNIKFKQKKCFIKNLDNFWSIESLNNFKKLKVPVSYCYGSKEQKTRLILPILKRGSSFVIKF